MASAAEQLAANLTSLRPPRPRSERSESVDPRRAAGRPLGTYIPSPGIDLEAWDQRFRQQAGGILGMSTMSPAVASTAWRSSCSTSCRTSGIDHHPAMTMVSPTLRRSRGGETGRNIMNQYTRDADRGSAVLRRSGSPSASKAPARRERTGPVRPDPTVITLTGGTMDPDVARRADHRARHRQRHLAHHHGGHRRGAAVGDRRASSSAARARCRPR